MKSWLAVLRRRSRRTGGRGCCGIEHSGCEIFDPGVYRAAFPGARGAAETETAAAGGFVQTAGIDGERWSSNAARRPMPSLQRTPLPLLRSVRMTVILALWAALAVCATSSLSGGMEHIARGMQGRVGMAAILMETGETVAFNGAGRFPMQSVYKLPIAMTVLQQVDRGVMKLDQRIRVEKRDLVPRGLRSPIRDQHPNGGFDVTLGELLRGAVSESDGTASDVLLRLAGGPAAVMRYLHELGIAGVVVANSEAEMSRGEMVQYRNWATPNDAVLLLRTLEEGRGLSAASRGLLLGYMTNTGTGMQRIKGLLPVGTVVAHKTGTSGTHDGLTRATNDIGLVMLPKGRHMAIAVFVSDSRADEAAREGVIAKMARAVWDCWAGR